MKWIIFSVKFVRDFFFSQSVYLIQSKPVFQNKNNQSVSNNVAEPFSITPLPK